MRSLRNRAMYLVINLTVADMFVGGFSHFSLFVTILYLCESVKIQGLWELSRDLRTSSVIFS